VIVPRAQHGGKCGDQPHALGDAPGYRRLDGSKLGLQIRARRTLFCKRAFGSPNLLATLIPFRNQHFPLRPGLVALLFGKIVAGVFVREQGLKLLDPRCEPAVLGFSLIETVLNVVTPLLGSLLRRRCFLVLLLQGTPRLLKRAQVLLETLDGLLQCIGTGRLTLRPHRKLVQGPRFAREAIIIKDIGRYRQAGEERLGLLIAAVKPVQPVKQSELVPGLQKQRFPLGLGRTPIRIRGFDNDNIGAMAIEVARREDILFGAFNIDLEEMHGLIGSVLFKYFAQGNIGHAARIRSGRSFGGQLRIHRPVSAGSGGIVGDFSLAGSDGDTQVDVPGTRRRQLGVQGGIRLDVDPVPASLVKVVGHAVFQRMTGADVDIEALLKVAESAPEHHVFRVLGEGEHGGQHRR